MLLRKHQKEGEGLLRSEKGQALAFTVVVISVISILSVTLATISLWAIKNEMQNQYMIQARASADSGMELAKMVLSLDPNPSDFSSEQNVIQNNYSGITLKSVSISLASSTENPDTSYTEIVNVDVIGASHNETKEASEQLKINYFPGHTLGSF